MVRRGRGRWHLVHRLRRRCRLRWRWLVGSGRRRRLPLVFLLAVFHRRWGRRRRLRHLLRRPAAAVVHDVDVPDHLAALAPELAGEPLRVKRPDDGDRLALVVEGDRPDPLAVCNNNSEDKSEFVRSCILEMFETLNP